MTYLSQIKELIELHQYIEAHDYHKVLELVADLEEIPQADKLNKPYGYGVMLLVPLIKQQTTRSWEFSTYNAVKRYSG